MRYYLTKFADYIRRTFKYKVLALILIGLGLVSVKILDNDATVCVFTLMMGIALFFSDDIERGM